MQLTHENNRFKKKDFPITLVCDHIYFQQNIDLSSLQPGTYILKISQGNQIIHQEKLMKR